MELFGSMGLDTARHGFLNSAPVDLAGEIENFDDILDEVQNGEIITV